MAAERSSFHDRHRSLRLVPFALWTVDVLKEFICKCPLVTSQSVVTGRQVAFSKARVEDRWSGQRVNIVASGHRLHVVNDCFNESREVRIVAFAREEVVGECPVLVFEI